jgi:hypothetical protein
MAGNECQLDLAYAPTAVSPTRILKFNYLYFDIFGVPRTGNIEIDIAQHRDAGGLPGADRLKDISGVGVE